MKYIPDLTKEHLLQEMAAADQNPELIDLEVD